MSRIQTSPGRTGHSICRQHWEELSKGSVAAGGSVCLTPKWLFLPIGA